MQPLDAACLGFAIGSVCGFGAAWLIRQGQVREQKAINAQSEKAFLKIEKELEAQKKEILKVEKEKSATEGRIQELKRAQEKLSDVFNSTALEILNKCNNQFLNQADHKLKGLTEPLSKQIQSIQAQVQIMENSRKQDYGSLHKEIQLLVTACNDVSSKASKLEGALRSPIVRGQWGQMQLRRIVELSGMQKNVDFVEQEQAYTSVRRPDMKINLPNDRVIIVDSKVPLEGFLKAIEATTEEDRKRFMGEHADNVRKTIEALSRKEYWDQFKDKSPEFVVMFIPNDGFLSAALETNHSIVEDAIQKKVFIATPSTLIALLKAVAYGWRQREVEENAQEIFRNGKQLYERLLSLVENLNSHGGDLQKSIDSYNKIIASFETRLLPSARRMKELGISDKDSAETHVIEGQPKKLSPPTA